MAKKKKAASQLGQAYRRFKKAREFVRALELKNGAEWRRYCQGELPGKPPRPNDIPCVPQEIYEDEGWCGLGDWLGTGRFSWKKLRPFRKARDFVQTLELKNHAEWEQYCKGDLPDELPKPDDIPVSPSETYKDKGWKGMGDWLGTGRFSRNKLRPFRKARAFVHRLALKNSLEWGRYCKGELPEKPPKPNDIPTSASKTYKDKGWKGMGDWLGTGTIDTRLRKFRPFKKARAFVHTLELKNEEEWRRYHKGELPDMPPKPNDIPATPQVVYKGNGWQRMSDWLGIRPGARHLRKHRPFRNARNFVQTLELKSYAEWQQYCQGELFDKPPKPADIPSNPRQIYKDKGWKGLGDWLGSSRFSPKKLRPYSKARAFVHTLELKSQEEWYRYCKGELLDLPPKPNDIPATPRFIYKDSGWQQLSDWLGTRPGARRLRKHRPFRNARNFVQTLELKSHADWQQYCQGELFDKPPKPADIPSDPHQIYKDRGWKGLGDWLGIRRFSRKKLRPFRKARAFVRALKLKNQVEWHRYCKGDLPGQPPKPSDIPGNPNQIYKDKGWKGLGDWLGTGTIAPFLRKYRPFEKARGFVRRLELKSQADWQQYCQGEFFDKPAKPDDIPASPSGTYKDKGWKGMGDWLGTGKFSRKNLRPFKEARDFIHTLGLKNQVEWRQYLQGELPGKRPKPSDIPAKPSQIYQGKGWQGLGDWLGTGTIAHHLRIYRPFKKARAFVRALKLKDQAEWWQYCKGELPDKPSKPDDIPTAAGGVYKHQGWQGDGDWLGTGTIASFLRKYRPFEKARAFVRALKLKNQTEWRQYCKGELPGKPSKPVDIPVTPDRVYRKKGWKGFRDWLRTS